MKDFIVPVASYDADGMKLVADALCVSVDQLAAFFFAKEVVHTSNR